MGPKRFCDAHHMPNSLIRSECAHCLFNPLCQCCIGITFKQHWTADPDFRRATMESGTAPMQHAIKSNQPDRHHRNSHARGNQSYPWKKGANLSGDRTLSFGKNQNGPPFFYQMPDVAKRLAGSGFNLWNGESIEDYGYQPIYETVEPSFPDRAALGVKVGIEVLFPHCRSNPITPTARKARQDGGSIEIALMIGDKNHCAMKACKILTSRDLQASEKPR